MTGRQVAMSVAVGRCVVGAVMLVAPRRVGRAWLGEPGAGDGAAVLGRALGVRDLVLGLIALHTAGHPEVGPRWQRTLAACDTVDLTATLAARRSLPAAGVAATVALAAPAIAAELWAAGRLSD